jgi:hypothetical protein
VDRSIWWRLVLAYGLGLATFFGVWSVIEHSAQQDYSALVNRGVHATATVTTYDPANHDDLEYAFTVQGVRYTGGGSFHLPGSFQSGQSIPVVYEANRPENNCACNPAAELENANWTPIVGGLWLGLAFPVWYLGQRSFRLRPGRKRETIQLLTRAEAVLASGLSQPGRKWSHAGFPRWLWSGGILEYQLTIPPQEAARRLAAAVKPDTFLRGFFPVVDLIGWVDGRQFQLTTRLPFVSNSFDSFLEGTIVEGRNGSSVFATFRTRRIVLIFLAIWMALAGLIVIPASIAALLNPASSKGGPSAVLFGLLFPLFGIALLVLGRLLATWQEHRLVGRLDRLFDVDPYSKAQASRRA